MVYESDFYTTRRPYSRPSTYSVTPLRIRFAPALPRVHTVTSYYPYGTSRLVGAPRTRLMISPSPPHHLITVRVRPDIVMRELDRIAYRHRPDFSYSASEDFMRSSTAKAWEDESRRIRADADSLRQRIHSTVPRASSVVPYNTYLSYARTVPYRFSSEDYLSKLLLPIRDVALDIRNMSWYTDPVKRFTGSGHLACIRYSGNKGFPNRKALSDWSIRDDVNLLSFYAKNRLAAAGLSHDSITAAPDKPAQEQPALVECA